MKTISNDSEMEELARQTLKPMHRRLIKDFLDIIILAKLKNAQSLGGYEIQEVIYQKFGFLTSPGTIYSMLYYLERKGIIKGESTSGKRIYALTDQGRQTIDVIARSQEEIIRFIQTLLSG